MPTSTADTTLRTVRGVVFDLDGTLILPDRELGGYRSLPGASDTLHELRARQIPFVALTNGSAYPAAQQAPRLQAVGLPIDETTLFTPNSVAGHVFRAAGFDRVMVIGTAGVREALAGEGVTTTVPGDDGAVDAVYIAWAPDCTMHDIHVAAEHVLNGAGFFTASDVPFFAAQHGRAFGYSCAIGGAIARVTGREPEVVGKPSQHAMDFVAAKLGLDAAEVAVVGDDPMVETIMARAGGALGIGVVTGTTDRAGWETTAPEARAHRVLDGVADLLTLGILG